MALLQGNLLSENNQSVETSVGGWASFGDGSSAIVVSTDRAIDGVNSVKCTRNAVAGAVAVCALTATVDLPVTVAAKRYTFTYWVWSPAGGTFNTLVDWYQSGNATFISTTTGSNYTAGASGWTQIGRADTQHTAPALGVTGRIYCQTTAGTATGNLIYVDQIYFGIPRRDGNNRGLQKSIQRASLF